MRKNNWDRLIVALDSEDKRKIKKLIFSLYPKVKKFKVGLIAYVKFGPSFIKMLREIGASVFFDLKFFDIPNTMEKAAFIAASFGVWAFTVHIKAGKEALKNLKKNLVNFCKEKKIKRPLIFGVTELTSKLCSQARVLKLVETAYSAGLDGVVASFKGASSIKEKYKGLKIITPGIRRKEDKVDDQKRIATASSALKYADYIVVGRPIIEAKDYLKAAGEVLSS